MNPHDFFFESVSYVTRLDDFLVLQYVEGCRVNKIRFGCLIKEEKTKEEGDGWEGEKGSGQASSIPFSLPPLFYFYSFLLCWGKRSPFPFFRIWAWGGCFYLAALHSELVEYYVPLVVLVRYKLRQKTEGFEGRGGEGGGAFH